ncbi:MAG TPA: type II secretion system F family protein [Candidatus Bathyarchaeia archaeon]|nr:type II secretion system F family protein [Candidatus Bathyarchaeia archaeon]
MSLLDPIVPVLGPLGKALAASDIIVIGLGLLGLFSLVAYRVKSSIFETSRTWVGATLVLSILTILFRGMTSICNCAWYTDAPSGAPTQLVPFTYMLISGSFFAILYNFNIPKLKKFKWIISVPLSIPISIFSNLFFPLVTPSPPWVFVEIVILAPIGAFYSTFVYEKAVLHMGDYRARLQRFFEQSEKAKKGGVELPPEKEGFTYFTYGLLGRRITKLLPIFNSLKQILALAGMKVGYKAYISTIIFAAMAGTAVSFFVWFLLFSLGLGYGIGLGIASSFIPATILFSIVFSILTGLAILGAGYMVPFMKMGSRRQHLDQFLPFTSSYMTVLASAGVTPERILRSTAEKDPKFMLSDEVANVIGRIDLLGYDVISALNAEVDHSPSTNYQDLLRGFAGVIRTGGDMKKFFQGITDHLFQKRALSVQAFLDTLGIIAETYVLMLIAFPLMLVVMLSIMASIGGSLGGIDVFSFMYLMAFILIPICGVMFLFILDQMQPKG